MNQVIQKHRSYTLLHLNFHNIWLNEHIAFASPVAGVVHLIVYCPVLLHYPDSTVHVMIVVWFRFLMELHILPSWTDVIALYAHLRGTR